MTTVLLIVFVICLMFAIARLTRENERTSWTNWGRNLSSQPIKIWYPKNLEELRRIIIEARTLKINVHAYGAGHSWSNLVPTSGYLVNTSHLNALLEVDHEKNQVRVEGGMPLHTLNQILQEHGLALSNLGRVTVQSIAGATATGTHGTGHTPTLASFIVEVELMMGDGTLHTISADHNPEYLSAARLSLGSVGIIYSVKVQCEPRFSLEDHCYITDFNDAFNNYEKYLQENEHWMFEWNPYSGKALCYAWNRTLSSPPASHGKSILAAIKEGTIDFLTIFTWLFPKLTPKLTDIHFDFTAHKPCCAESYRVLTRPYRGMRYVECEMAIRPALLPNAIEELKKFFSKHQAQGIFVPRVTFRFVSEEKGTLLSPTYDGNRVFISLVMPSHSRYDVIFPDFQNLMEAFDARPHWGKIHRMDQELAFGLYGENMKTFLKIRDLLDPEKVFMNDQIASIITPP